MHTYYYYYYYFVLYTLLKNSNSSNYDKTFLLHKMVSDSLCVNVLNQRFERFIE